MNGSAKAILRSLATGCSEGSFLFKEAGPEAYCSLIVTEDGAYNVCPFAAKEVVVVRENLREVVRHPCTADALPVSNVVAADGEKG